MVKQCTILFGCMALGELLVAVTGLSLPGSIVGMLLLAAFLEMGWVKLEWVKAISDFLLSNLGFFFVPPGVALMLNFDTIALAHHHRHARQHRACFVIHRLDSPNRTSLWPLPQIVCSSRSPNALP